MFKLENLEVLKVQLNGWMKLKDRELEKIGIRDGFKGKGRMKM